MSYMGRVWLWNQTHTQTEHLVVLFTLYTKWRLFCVLTAVTLGLRRKVYCLLSLLCSYYTFMCPWADFYSAHPNSLSLSVFLSLQARQRACPSISAVWCMRHTHTSYLGWRSSSQCHFQFGWDWGLFGLPNGLADGREMLADAANNVCVSDPLILRVGSSTVHAWRSFLHSSMHRESSILCKIAYASRRKRDLTFWPQDWHVTTV